MRYLFLFAVVFFFTLSCSNKEQQQNEHIKQQVSALWQRGMAEPQPRPDSITILHTERITEKALLGAYIGILEKETAEYKKYMEENESSDYTSYEPSALTGPDSIYAVEQKKMKKNSELSIAAQIHVEDSIKQVYAKANGTDIYGCKVHAIIHTTERGKPIDNDETIFIANDENMYFVDIYALTLHKLPPFKMNQ